MITPRARLITMSRLVGGVFLAGSALGFAWVFVDRETAPMFGRTQLDILTGTIWLVLGLLARRAPLSERVLTALAHASLNITAFVHVALVGFNHVSDSLAFGVVSWHVVLIAFYPLIIPAHPRRMLAATAPTVIAAPLGLWVGAALGGGTITLADAALVAIPCVVATALATVGARLHASTSIDARELRQAATEIAASKTVVRTLSHELNNSLAAMSSKLHSATIMVDQPGQKAQLRTTLGSLRNSAQQLNSFLTDYAEATQIPDPEPQQVAWDTFLDSVGLFAPVNLAGPIPTLPALFDPSLMERAFVNLLLNAEEAGSPPDRIRLSIALARRGWRISISDEGPGFSDEALQSGMVPFWTTKPGGSGVGLALTREIIVAHGGSLVCGNHEAGAIVTIFLPEVPSPRTDSDI